MPAMSITSSRAIGAMFLSSFGTLWLIAATFQYFDGANAAAIAVCLLLGALLFSFSLWKYRRGRAEPPAGSDADAARIKKGFSRVNTVQWVTIVAAIILLNVAGMPQWIEPAILLIVGLHFLPLARLFHNPPHYATGTLLVMIAVAYPFLSPQGSENPSGAFGAGVVLWGAALLGLLGSNRAKEESPA